MSAGVLVDQLGRLSGQRMREICTALKVVACD
jgi:hypothetical protein